MNLPSLSRSRSALLGLAFLLTLAFGFVFYHFLEVAVVAIFFYYVARPIEDWLSSYIPTKTLPAVLAISIVVLPAVLIIVFSLFALTDELFQLYLQSDFQIVRSFLQTYASNFDQVYDVEALIQNPTLLFEQNDFSVFQSLGQIVLQYVGNLVRVLLDIGIVLIVGVYLLRDGKSIVHCIHEYFDSTVLSHYITEVDRDFKAIFFGNVLNAALTGIIGLTSFLAFSLLTPLPLEYPVLAGLLCGIASLIPVVGTKLVYVPYGLSFLLKVPPNEPQYISFWIIFMAFSLIVIDGIPDLLLRPYFSSKGMPLGLLIIAYTVGPLLFGWVGIFVGPILFVAAYHFLTIVLPALVGEQEEGPRYLH